MPGLLRPKNLFIFGGGAAGLYYIYSKQSGAPTLMTTPGVQQIGDRWSAGGGSDVHTPGVATPRGNKDATLEPQINPKGIRSDHFKENVADQKAHEPNAIGKMWQETHYGPGNSKGK